MGDVVDLSSARPHLSGPCQCTECGHEWMAVRELGVTDLECPECFGEFGVPKSECVPEEFWECNCGSHLFYLTRDGAFCRRCGITSLGWLND